MKIKAHLKVTVCTVCHDTRAEGCSGIVVYSEMFEYVISSWIYLRKGRIGECNVLSLYTHRFSTLCVSCWWWSLMSCPESAGRWPMAFMNCWRLMQPTSTVQTTGTHSSPCWSALELEWNLPPPSSSPPPLLTTTQVKYISLTFMTVSECILVYSCLL